MSDLSASEHMLSGAPQREWRCVSARGHFAVEATTDEILRVAFTPANVPPHRSWSLAPSQVPGAGAVTIDSQGDHASLRTNVLYGELSVPDNEEALRLLIARHDGSPVLAHVAVRLAANGRPVWTSALANGEVIYG